MSTHGNARPGKYGTPAGLFTRDTQGIATWDRARYQWRRAHGLCVSCGRTADAGVNCAACRARVAARNAARKRRLRAAGICTSCGCERTDRWHCDACVHVRKLKEASS
jgi:hypothetical protein